MESTGAYPGGGGVNSKNFSRVGVGGSNIPLTLKREQCEEGSTAPQTLNLIP